MLLVFDIPPSLSAQSLSYTHTHTLLTLIEDVKVLLCLNVVPSESNNSGKYGLLCYLRDTIQKPKTTAVYV